jgi:hypothetical protein
MRPAADHAYSNTKSKFGQLGTLSQEKQLQRRNKRHPVIIKKAKSFSSVHMD